MFGLASISFFLASTLVYAAPVPRDTPDAATLLKNGQTAQNLNAQFKTMSADSSCTTGAVACIAGDLASCVNDKWQTEGCPNSLSCFVVPLLSQSGINVTCTSERNALSTIKATGASGAIAVANADQDTSDDNDDTCESEGGDASTSSSGKSTAAPAASPSAPASKAAKTVTVTAPADSGPATVTVTVTPSASPASVTVPSSTITQATTTVLSGAAASSIISLLSEQGGQISTTIVGSFSATPSSATHSIIELTQPAATPSVADNAGASASAVGSSSASRSIIQLTAPAAPSAANNAGADSQPVLTLASPAATTAPAANPFPFSDY